MATDHNVFNEKFFKKKSKAEEQMLKFDNDLFSKSVQDLLLLLVSNDIDYRIYTSYKNYASKNINFIVLKKKFIPDFIQKRKIVKLMNTQYKQLPNYMKLKVFYAGDIIVNYTKVVIPVHPMCKSFFTPIKGV
jgi:choline kinase